MQPSLTASRTIAVVASALGLFCACGLGPPTYHPPPPDLVSVSVNQLDFTGSLGKTSPSQHFSIANISRQTVTLSSPSTWIQKKNSPFTFQTDCGASLAPNSSCTVTISFLPVSGALARTILVLHIETHEPHYVVLEGRTDHSQP